MLADNNLLQQFSGYSG